jgi:hypothetical protein
VFDVPKFACTKRLVRVLVPLVVTVTSVETGVTIMSGPWVESNCWDISSVGVAVIIVDPLAVAVDSMLTSELRAVAVVTGSTTVGRVTGEISADKGGTNIAKVVN